MTLRQRLRPLPRRGLHALGRVLRHDLVARNFYSPVPDLRALPADTFTRRSELPGVAANLDRALSLLAELREFMLEFRAPPGFDWRNAMYNYVDADVLYAMVRRAPPRRVIELGSGNSTLIIAAALRRNETEGHPARYSVYDPYATPLVRAAEGVDLKRISAADVPRAEFDALDAGDILFVDTTHTVKTGGEVNRIVLEILPRLSPGVIVHVHDIFLPYEYPRRFLERGLFWSEQYLLQAYLAENPRWRVLLPLFALVRERPEQMERLVPSFRADAGPAGYWLERLPG